MLNRTMTDHVPNDLSHLSDAEFNSLCPQGEHAPGPEPLSPAAQAVLDATEGFCGHRLHSQQSVSAAAAIRAAADQVVPPLQIAPACKNLESRREAMELGMRQQTQITRNQLLAIAYELERQP
jgi:hypothetical protein